MVTLSYGGGGVSVGAGVGSGSVVAVGLGGTISGVDPQPANSRVRPSKMIRVKL